MNKIEKLIEELCPEGVHWGIIGDHINYEQPTKYIVSSTDYSDSNSTPVLTAGQTFILGRTDETFGIYEASPDNPVIIFDDFTTAFKWVDFPFKVKSSAMKILRPTTDSPLSLRFLFHYMGAIGFSASEHARHWISIYSQIKIPTPPLQVQQEIVSILDKFTQLEAELEAELEARLIQYQSYRDQLFDFRDQLNQLGELSKSNVAFRSLKDSGHLYAGLSGKTKSDFSEGNSLYVSYVEVFNNLSLPKGIKGMVRISAEENQNRIARGDLLFTGSSEDKEGVGITSEVEYEPDEPLFLNSFCFGYRPHSSVFTTGYLKHLFRSSAIRKAVIQCSNGVTRVNISKKHLLEVIIPVPPKEIQSEIVRILDSFEDLVSNIVIGLPAEITARRQQYEYYRNKLLAFKELEAS